MKHQILSPKKLAAKNLVIFCISATVAFSSTLSAKVDSLAAAFENAVSSMPSDSDTFLTFAETPSNNRLNGFHSNIWSHTQESNSNDIRKKLGVMSERAVLVDLNLFRKQSSIGPAERDVYLTSDARRFISFQPSTDLALELDVRSFATFPGGVETYSGRVNNVAGGYFVFSITNEQISGIVALGNLVYELKQGRERGAHILREIDIAMRVNDSPDPKNSRLQSHTKTHGVMGNAPSPILKTQGLSSPQNGNVRVLILYTDGMTGAAALAANVITTLNDSVRWNGIDFDNFFTLAGTRELNDALATVCKTEILGRMEDNTAPFQNVDTWLANDDADLVLTIIGNSATRVCANDSEAAGGRASGLFDETVPYSVVYQSYALAGYDGAHEIGHLVGGGHSVWTTAQIHSWNVDVDGYARGFTVGSGDWQTMMGSYGTTACSFDPADGTNQDCTRLLKWSDPTESHNGTTIGVIPVGGTQGNDMATWLDDAMPDVAEWEGYPGSAPGVPGNFDVQSENCYGYNYVDWSSTNGATQYQAFRSMSASFSNPYLVYSGTATGFGVNMSPSQPQYYKVRACNGNGCGNVTSQDVTTYLSGCL